MTPVTRSKTDCNDFDPLSYRPEWDGHSDWRSRDPEFTEPKLSKNLALVERLRKVGQKYRRPPGQVAVVWGLHNPVVTAAIVGARSVQQVEQNVGAAELDLTDNDIAEMEGSKEQEPEPVTRA